MLGAVVERASWRAMWFPSSTSLFMDDLLRAEAPSAEAQDPVDDGELQLLVQLTTEHCRRRPARAVVLPMLALLAMELVQRPDVEVRQLTSLVARTPR